MINELFTSIWYYLQYLLRKIEAGDTQSQKTVVIFGLELYEITASVSRFASLTLGKPRYLLHHKISKTNIK